MFPILILLHKWAGRGENNGDQVKCGSSPLLHAPPSKHYSWARNRKKVNIVTNKSSQCGSLLSHLQANYTWSLRVPLPTVGEKILNGQQVWSGLGIPMFCYYNPDKCDVQTERKPSQIPATLHKAAVKVCEAGLAFMESLCNTEHVIFFHLHNNPFPISVTCCMVLRVQHSNNWIPQAFFSKKKLFLT